MIKQIVSDVQIVIFLFIKIAMVIMKLIIKIIENVTYV